MDCQYGSQVESRMNNRELVRSARFFLWIVLLMSPCGYGSLKLADFPLINGNPLVRIRGKKQRVMHIAGMKPLSEKLVLGPRPLSFVPCCFDFVF